MLVFFWFVVLQKIGHSLGCKADQLCLLLATRSHAGKTVVFCVPSSESDSPLSHRNSTSWLLQLLCKPAKWEHTQPMVIFSLFIIETDIIWSSTVPSVFIFCCYSKIPQSEQLMHNRILPRVLESGAPNIKVPASGKGCLVSSTPGRIWKSERGCKKERSKRK